MSANPQRRPLSAEVIQRFVKDPSAIPSSNTEVITESNTEKLTELNNEANTNLNAKVNTRANTEVRKSANVNEPFIEQKNPVQEQGGSTAADIVSKLKSPEKESTVRHTVDLPHSVHLKLGLIAKKLGKPASAITKVLIEEFVADVEKNNLL